MSKGDFYMRAMGVGFFAAIILNGCTAAQLQTAQTDISTGIQAACVDVKAAAALNPASPSATYATGACGTATAVAALVQNSGTLVWLGTIMQQLKPAA